MKPRLVRAALLSLALGPFGVGLAAAPAAPANPDLTVGPGDLRIEARADGGFDLYVRVKPGLASILLTESTKDPEMKADNFAYRAAEYNEVNGAEVRLLDGKPLPASSRLYSLISSTPVADPVFGKAFRILIPPVLLYGYPWSRSGSVAAGQGTYLNIRAFQKPYGDYRGAFRDNPYAISITARPPPPPPAPPAIEPSPAPPPPQAPAPPPPDDDRTSSKLVGLIEPEAGKSLDLVVCLDTTDSMTPYIDDLRAYLGPVLKARVAGFSRFRIGIVLFRDYWPDDYITRKYPFTTDISAAVAILKGAKIGGGGDIPEAQIEALYTAATDYDWSADRRQVILVTDAPPHPDPRGKILFDDFLREAAARHIEGDAIIEPKDLVKAKPSLGELPNELSRLSALAAAGKAVRLLVLPDALRASILASPPPGLSPGIEVLSAPGTSPAAGVEVDKAGALKAGIAAGASHVIFSRTLSSGGFTERVTRLLELPGGTELAHDVAWSAQSAGTSALFIDGTRVR